MGLHGNRPRALRHLGGGELRRGDDDQFRGGHQLSDGDGHVAGAGRKVHQQHVEVAPVHVAEELLHGPVQHGSPPDDGRVARREHPDGDHLHVVRGRRHDHLLDLRGPAGDAKHARHRVTVDVRVEHPDLLPGRGQGRSQVHGH
jgi:hypothetical protein